MLRICVQVRVSDLLWLAPSQGSCWGGGLLHACHHTVKPDLLGCFSEESDLARGDGPTRCSRHPRCLQALSAISTHPSIVKETLPLLLQHLCQMNRGEYRAQSLSSWAGGELQPGLELMCLKPVPVMALVRVTKEPGKCWLPGPHAVQPIQSLRRVGFGQRLLRMPR